MEFSEYFDWLIAKIDCEKYPVMDYTMLLEALYENEYLWYLPMDANRAVDGLEMRRDYILETGDDDVGQYLDGYCSILEMMVALADRCECQIMGDLFAESTTWQWFWVMIESLGLADCEDGSFDDDIFDKTIEKLSYNGFKKNGEGGLFRTESDEIDMRKLDIWQEMMVFLTENYSFEV